MGSVRKLRKKPFSKPKESQLAAQFMLAPPKASIKNKRGNENFLLFHYLLVIICNKLNKIDVQLLIC